MHVFDHFGALRAMNERNGRPDPAGEQETLRALRRERDKVNRRLVDARRVVETLDAEIAVQEKAVRKARLEAASTYTIELLTELIADPHLDATTKAGVARAILDPVPLSQEHMDWALRNIGLGSDYYAPKLP